MAVLVGIDEAGYGPIIGPLVLSSCAISMPSEMLDKDLWKAFSKSISKSKKRLGAKLLIADSKKAFDRETGIKTLERTVLAAMRAAGMNPPNLHELLTSLCPDSMPQFSQYPWYQNMEQCGIVCLDSDVAIAAKVFSADMEAKHCRLEGIKTVCLEVAHYNRLVEAANNKANVLFSSSCRLIASAIEKYGDKELQIVVDRQGGRMRYVETLAMMFPGFKITILRENEKNSSYELTGSSRKLKIHFVVSADDRFMPVSLASMFCKYVRERLMERINDYFISHHPELKPTAGYWKDGSRFIKDLENLSTPAAFDPNQLIRCR